MPDTPTEKAPFLLRPRLKGSESTERRAEWGVMAYLAADNDLEGELLADLAVRAAVEVKQPRQLLVPLAEVGQAQSQPLVLLFAEQVGQRLIALAGQRLQRRRVIARR